MEGKLCFTAKMALAGNNLESAIAGQEYDDAISARGSLIYNAECVTLHFR
jgi:hypothetical protein